MLPKMPKLLSIESGKATIPVRHCRHYEDITLPDSQILSLPSQERQTSLVC